MTSKLSQYPKCLPGRMVTIAEAAAVTGVGEVTLRDALANGHVIGERGGSGRKIMIDVGSFITYLLHRLDNEWLAEVGEVEGEMDAKTRKLEAEADIAEFKMAQIRGNLVPLDLVGKAVANQYANLRAKLLGLPANLAGVLVSAPDETAIREYLEGAIHAALEELATAGVFADVRRSNSADADSGGDDADAPAEVEHKRVGRQRKTPIA